jgi:hypothetical protein
MSQSGWKYAAFIIFTGFGILIVSELLYFMGFDAILHAWTIILTPTTALLLGVSGLNFFGRESLVKEDRFHAMNVWMALGLVVFSLAEIAGILIRFSGSEPDIYFTVGLVQMPALLLWGLGVIGYLRSSNSALKLFAGDKMGSYLIVVISIAGILLVVIMTLVRPAQSFLITLVSAPMIVGLAITFSILGGITWILREGMISKPLILLLLGILLLLIRSVFWGFINYSPESPFDNLTAIEGYILVGAAVAVASKIDEVYFVRESEEIE